MEIMNAATNSNMKFDEGEERVNVCGDTGNDGGQ